MRVIPGSHLQGGFHDNYVPTDMTVQTFHAEIPDVDESQAVDFELERGEFSLHDGRIVHGAKPNTSDIRRTGYTMRYFPASVKMMPVEQNEGWKIWLARGEDRAGNTLRRTCGADREPMHRGVYFDAWFPRQHCYHPSLPPRRLRMVEDLVDYRATMLVWASLGGGSLALPYLEQEAFGPVEPRARFYGFVNDSEFIAACHAQGIQVMGIVFEAQGWEFPVELNDDETEILALNELRGVGHRDWLGLREFSSNRYPKLWPAFETYFPGGLTQQPRRAGDRPDRGVRRPRHRPEPVPRPLGGVPRPRAPVLLHGPQQPGLARVPQGGHPDPDRRRGRRHPARRGRAAAGGDAVRRLLLQGLHGRASGRTSPAWTRRRPSWPGSTWRPSTTATGCASAATTSAPTRPARRCSAPTTPTSARRSPPTSPSWPPTPASTAAAWAASVLVSGNFFNLDPHYLPLADEVDLIITEMRNTTYRQPEWYRYVDAFRRYAGVSDVIVVENPYGGVVPELVDALAAGRGHDRLRLSLYEAAAFGANMSAPYGSWMGATIQDSFWAPHGLLTEIQDFVADDRAAALDPQRARGRRGLRRGQPARPGEPGRLRRQPSNARDASVEVPFRRAAEALSLASVPFDVVLATDGGLAGDRFVGGRAGGVPDRGAARLLVADRAPGRGAGRVPGRRWSRAGQRRPRRQRGVGGAGPAARAPEPDPLRAGRGAAARCPTGRRWWPAAAVAVNLHRLDDGFAVHLVNYGYDDERDAVARDRRPRAGRPAARRGPPAPRSCDPAGPPEPVELARDRGRRPRTPGRRRSLHRGGAAVRLAELAGVEDYRVVEVDRPRPAAGELLVEVHACGVCASELDAWTGRVPADFPLRNGHEVSGVVVELGTGVTDFAVGDPVAVWTTGSGYAEYVTAPAAYCRPLGDVPLEVGLLEPIACAANAVELADVRLADDVVIIGAGFMGALVQQLVQLRGARTVTVVDRRPDVLAAGRRAGRHPDGRHHPGVGRPTSPPTSPSR